jgi:hypothetical protein
MRNGKFVPHATAEVVRECDPSGAIVVYPVRRSAYVHEKLDRLSGPQELAHELYDAAEKFRTDFERAHSEKPSEVPENTGDCRSHACR